MNQFEREFELKTGLNFSKFYLSQKPKLVWYLSKWTKDISIAEDWADEAFIKALNSIDSYIGTKSQVHTWLYTIATNFVKHDYQKQQRMPLISMDKDVGNGASISMFLPEHDTNHEVEVYLETCKKADIIKEAIFNMSDKQNKYKTVLIMREVENMSYNEISEQLSINLSTIKSQIKKGREIIRNKVEKKLSLINEYGLR